MIENSAKLKFPLRSKANRLCDKIVASKYTNFIKRVMRRPSFNQQNGKENANEKVYEKKIFTFTTTKLVKNNKNFKKILRMK